VVPSLRCKATQTFSRGVRLGKDGRDLEGAHDPAQGDVGRFFPGDIEAVERDVTARRGEKLGQQVENSRLAGSVGSDQGMNMAPFDTQVYIAHGNKAAKLLGEVFGFKDMVSHRCTAPRSSIDQINLPSRYSVPGDMESGKANTVP